MNISEQIETSFGDGPSHRSLEDRLSAGRRARRRRKSAEGMAAVAGVAVLGLAAYTLAPGGTPDTAKDPGFAGDPSANASMAASSSAAPPDAAPPAQQTVTPEWADYGADGEIVLGDGVTERERVPNPLNLQLPKRSVGLELERNGERIWMLLELDVTENGDGISNSTQDPAQKSFATLQQWLDNVALTTDGDELQLVEFGVGETLKALDGVTIVQQRPSPDVGESFASPSDRSAVAEVRFDGETWFVLARQTVGGSGAEYFPTAKLAGRQTLAEFLEYARGQYGNGEGLR